MTPQGLAAKLLAAEQENKLLRELVEKLTVTQDAAKQVGLTTEIFERLINFDIAMLREGSRGIRWIGMSTEEYAVCAETAKGANNRGMFFSFAEGSVGVSLFLPGGETRCTPVKGLPNGCYIQIREPMVVRAEQRSYRLTHMPKSRTFGSLTERADPTQDRLRVTELRFDIVPRQTIAVEVEGLP